MASGTGAQAGVVVTWVDPQGPAAGHLAATDVIEAIDDESLFTYEHWRARVDTAGRWTDDLAAREAPQRRRDGDADRPLLAPSLKGRCGWA